MAADANSLGPVPFQISFCNRQKCNASADHRGNFVLLDARGPGAAQGWLCGFPVHRNVARKASTFSEPDRSRIRLAKTELAVQRQRRDIGVLDIAEHEFIERQGQQVLHQLRGHPTTLVLGCGSHESDFRQSGPSPLESSQELRADDEITDQPVPRPEMALEFTPIRREALLIGFGEARDGGGNPVHQRHIKMFRDDHVGKRPRQRFLILGKVGEILGETADEHRGNVRWLKSGQCIDPFDFDHCDPFSLGQLNAPDPAPGGPVHMLTHTLCEPGVRGRPLRIHPRAAAKPHSA